VLNQSLNVYVATALGNALVAKELAERLKAEGCHITYEWWEHGPVQHLGFARVAEVARAEMQGVLDADVLVALLPGGRGTHAEIGLALGGGRAWVLLAGPRADADGRESSFYYAPQCVHLGPGDDIVRVLRQGTGGPTEFHPDWSHFDRPRRNHDLYAAIVREELLRLRTGTRG